MISVILTTLIVLIIPGYFMFESQRQYQASVALDQENIQRGADIFAANCSTCHGVQGQGNAIQPSNNKPSGAPPLRGYVTQLGPDGKPQQVPWTKSRNEDYIRKTISAGRPPLGGNPPPGQVVMPTWSDRFGGPLDDLSIDYLVDFLESQQWNLVKQSAELPAAFAKATPAAPVAGPQTVPAGAAGPAGSGIVTVDTGAAPYKPGSASAGKQVFETKGCTGCHTIAGISTGTVGPNLTHIATTPYDHFPNTAAFMKQWIHNPPAAKPGTVMPNLGLTDQELNDVVTFLQTLK